MVVCARRRRLGGKTCKLKVFGAKNIALEFYSTLTDIIVYSTHTTYIHGCHIILYAVFVYKTKKFLDVWMDVLWEQCIRLLENVREMRTFTAINMHIYYYFIYIYVKLHLQYIGIYQLSNSVCMNMLQLITYTWCNIIPKG